VSKSTILIISQQDIEALIEDKIQKNIDKVLHNWEDEGILVEKHVGDAQLLLR
jgi:hypothetical protein